MSRPVPADLLQSVIAEFVQQAKDREQAAVRAREVGHRSYGDYMDGKAEGFRFCAIALSELLEPGSTAAAPSLKAVQ
jgi:hypothetical protein